MARKRQHYSGIGGQAVLEGVMMRNGQKYAVAVRKPDGGIEVDVEEYRGILEGSPVKKIPFVRGIFVFIDSLILGMRSLNYSTSFYDEEDTGEKNEAKEKAEMGIITAISFVLAIVLFMLVPYFAASFLNRFVRNASLMAILEGLIRLFIFIVYIAVIACMKDIKRLYQYHGAEHKCINCIEKGRALTVENARRSTRFHRRCGTSFILLVVIVSIIVFFFIRSDSLIVRLGLRILLIPVISGISYELIRLAGAHDGFLTAIISAPGLWMQRLTTKEPDDTMLECAIASVNAVFDWKAYLQSEFGYEPDGDES